MVTYEYDSWGKLLSIKDENQNEITDETNIGIINSFRYRGYYYDTETGLYYLNSRYYNPTWSRFLNADRILGANSDIVSYNLYLYTSNNSVNNSDPMGTSSFRQLLNKILDKILRKIPGYTTYKNSTSMEKHNLVTHPAESAVGFVSSMKAISIGRKIYGDKIDEDHTRPNAYKHAMWNAIMTYDMGITNAKMIGDAHEYGESNIEGSQMDLHNNAIGRQIGEIYKINEAIARNNVRPTPSRVYQSFDISFVYLGKTFKTDLFSPNGAYNVMSDMVQHAIDQGVMTILIQ